GYATANAVAGFFLIIADIGLAPRLVREASRDPACVRDVYARSMSVKTLTSLVVAGLLVALFLVLPYEPWVRNLTILLSVSWLIRSYTQMNHSVVRACERMELEAVSVLVQTGVFLLGALGCLYLGFSLVSLGWVAIAAAMVQLAVSTLIARRFTPIRIAAGTDWATLRDAAPYTATLLAFIAFAQSNVVILSLIATQALVGEFTSVSRILLLASVFPQLINLAVVPASSRVFGQDDAARFRRLTTASLRILLVLAGAAAVVLVVISKPLVRWIYGEELEPLFPYLQLGTLYLVFQFASGALGMTLTAAGRQASRARATVIALVATVFLVVTLTLQLGVQGAVLALVLGELALVVAEAFPAWDLLDPGDALRNAAWVFGAGGLAVGSHFALLSAGLFWPASLVPVLVYAAVLLELIRHRR
ncbi:MAG: oligosaccharide flippase family protein, partial [Myxococcota bacterium]